MTVYDALGAAGKVSRYTVGVGLQHGVAGTIGDAGEAGFSVFSSGESHTGQQFHYVASVEL